MDDNELFDKIELYLKKELDPNEMKTFEIEMLNNPELAKLVKKHQLEWDAMEVLIEKDLREKMTLWKNPLTETPSVSEPKTTVLPLKSATKTVRFYWLAAIAASVSLLMAAAFWLFNKPQNPNPEITQSNPNPKIDTPSVIPPAKQEETPKSVENIKKQDKNVAETPKKTIQTPNSVSKNDDTYIAFAEEAYQKSDVPSYEDIQSTRGNSAENTVLDEAGKAYDKKDFNKTITLLKNTAATDDNFTALEILAHAAFQAKNYKMALPVFQNLVKLSGKKSHDKSEWFLLLCFLTDLKSHQVDFKSLSDKIINNKSHEYFSSTKALMMAVEKLH